jgi:2-polyprenyl-3-methyl-5-hydroxy-6-metoxy-1,4-benzoquinol methylase
MEKRSHNYDYAVYRDKETAGSKVIRFVGNEKRVLEVGCGPGSITKYLHHDGHCQIIGLELDPEAIRLVSPYCERVHPVDLNHADWTSLAEELGTFDVIVAADVLEHLYDPWDTLAQFLRFLKPDGNVVVSLPHAGHAAVISCLIQGDFEYRDWGLLDRTHIRFFGLSNIDNLFRQANLKIIDYGFVITPPEETEFASTWQSLSQEARESIGSSPHANIYQVVVKAVPISESGQSISLVQQAELNRNSLRRSISLRTRVGNLLSDRQKTIVKSLLPF